MRSNYDARQEHSKDYWLGIAGSVLVVVTIITSLFQVF